jgi:hypothetical protein
MTSISYFTLFLAKNKLYVKLVRDQKQALEVCKKTRKKGRD